MAAGFDRTSIAGKEFPLAGQSQLVVIGAGAAGVAAAIEAARLGLSVTLIDEHPVASGLIGLDVPYMVGERMTAAIQNQARMVEQIATARPDIADAFEAGVDVQMGISAWAAFVEGPTSRALPGRMLALADESRSWLIGFERMIVAAGARDLALAFPGWDRPGVMGAQGFGAAVTLYDAFAGRRIAVLGGGVAALQVVRQAQAAGIEVAAVISAAPTVDAELIATGVEILAGCAIRGVLGAMEVEGVIAAPLAGGPERRFACDSIVSAIDVAPTVEMFDLLNCATVFDRARGGYVPVIDAEQRCTLPGIYAAGDCAGVSDAGLLDPALARAEGIRAARSAARDAGLAAPEDKSPARAEGPARDSWRREWLSAHAGPQAPELIICRCEEVTLHDLLGVRPPRYLKYDEKNFESRDLRSLAQDGPVNQDQIKRLTRAGMGACQGRRCREQVQELLAMQGNQPPSSIPLPSFRAPLRPIPLSVLSAADETPGMRANWSGWFGIAAQWIPHWEKVPENPEYYGGRIFSGGEE